ncbi:MAG: hypothetical protein M1838_004341 [Thelocarpon superellum]|nr:MAG: hypothetical protein M1838_004341 [Thelocarpon superellum]
MRSFSLVVLALTAATTPLASAVSLTVSNQEALAARIWVTKRCPNYDDNFLLSAAGNYDQGNDTTKAQIADEILHTYCAAEGVQNLTDILTQVRAIGATFFIGERCKPYLDTVRAAVGYINAAPNSAEQSKAQDILTSLCANLNPSVIVPQIYALANGTTVDLDEIAL